MKLKTQCKEYQKTSTPQASSTIRKNSSPHLLGFFSNVLSRELISKVIVAKFLSPWKHQKTYCFLVIYVEYKLINSLKFAFYSTTRFQLKTAQSISIELTSLTTLLVSCSRKPVRLLKKMISRVKKIKWKHDLTFFSL